MLRVEVSKKEVVEVTLRLSPDVAEIICIAIGAAGDGAMDPLNTIQRAQASELVRGIDQAIKEE